MNMRNAKRGVLVIRRLIMQFAICFLAFNTSIVGASDKKGVGLDPHVVYARARLSALNVVWYYTWGPASVDSVNGVADEKVSDEKFVPMIYGMDSVHKGQVDWLRTHYVRLHGKVPTLLVFNEPDIAGQANMSVEAALHHWPVVASLTEHISSPVVANIARSEFVLGPWFDRFDRMARASGFKYDFIAVHLYGPPDAKYFLNRIDAIFEKYKQPIWITEFAVADWDASANRCKLSCKNRYTEDEVLNFMKAVLPELEKRHFVVRYAWFSGDDYNLSHEEVRPSRLFDKDGSLSTLGRYYAQFQ